MPNKAIQPSKYTAAIALCEVATHRLKCLNDKLAKDGVTDDNLSPKLRARVKKYYEDHLVRCEGIVLPIN